MKTVEVEQKYQVYQTKKAQMFETEDGKKFNTEEEAIKHEEYLNEIKILNEKYKIKNIDTDEYGIEYSDNLLSSKLLFITELDDETKKDLIFLYPYLGYDIRKLNLIKSGYNFFIETEYDTCSYGKWSGYSLYIYNLNGIIDEKENQLKKLKELL